MSYEEPSLAPPYLPIEVSDIEIAFPAHGLRLMPKREDMPETNERWNALAHALFSGTADELQLLPSIFMVENNFEPETAWRHLRCVLGSYEPKHEHKMEAVAFLLSLWFRHASWLDNQNPKLAKVSRERKAGSPDLPPEYEERRRLAMAKIELPRKRPCASCPYRCDVPSGVWDASEYEKLPQYDGDIASQAMAGAVKLFGCHQADGHLCAGWAGHRPPDELLAVRLALSDGRIDPEVLDYETDVRLFPSGAATAEHGMTEIDAPSERAEQAIRKLKDSVPHVTTG